LYLWHYPIFAFARVLDFQGSLFNKLLIGSVTIILSIFSYYFVELPARNKKKNFKFKFIFQLVILNYLFIFCLSLFFLNNKYLFFDKNIIEFNELENTRSEWEKCKISKIKNFQYCQIGDFYKKVYLIGDSHVIPLARDLGNKLNNKNFSLVLMYEPSYFYKVKKKI
jgi:hypothetical protein